MHALASTSPQIAGPVLRRSAEIAVFPKAKLPPEVDDFGPAAARLIWMTFAGASAHAKARDAERRGLCSVDTVERILGGRVERQDARLLFAVLAIFQARTGDAFPIGGGFEIAIIRRGAPEVLP